MGLGEAHLAMIALGASSRNLIYGGENLSLISQSMSDRTKMIVSEAAVQNMNTIKWSYVPSYLFSCRHL